MPVYDYFCAKCDEEFSQLQPMARCSEPTPCPQCDHSAARIISAPRLNTMRADMRSAHQVNERSAHQPKMTQAHRCGAGCTHNSTDAKPQLKQASSAKRPWMIGH
jgi:putative FmdB family regulatory protein